MGPRDDEGDAPHASATVGSSRDVGLAIFHSRFCSRAVCRERAPPHGPRVPRGVITPILMTLQFRTLSTAFLLAVFALTTGCAQAQPATTQTAETQASMTPEAALQMLMDGNERFLSGDVLDRDLTAQVAQTASGQYPFAFVLGCVDSRVPHEAIFDQGIGDIFSGRVAGNFVNTDLLGSMEFATAAAGSKVIVVLGHTECGAVKGACDHVELGNLTHTLSNIQPAIYQVGDTIDGDRSSSNKEYVDAVTHANVDITVQNIIDRSPVMKGLVASGDLIVIGAMHDVATGEVTFMTDSMVSASTLDM